MNISVCKVGFDNANIFVRLNDNRPDLKPTDEEKGREEFDNIGQ